MQNPYELNSNNIHNDKNNNLNRKNIIEILQDIQDKYNYIPIEEVHRISNETKTPLIEIIGIITFYNQFSLDKPDHFIITVCKGTACHTRGSDNIYEIIKQKIDDFKNKGIKITLKTVNCVGACSIAPVVLVNGKIYGKINPDKINTIFDEILNETKVS